jgi:hypothetical protein
MPLGLRLVLLVVLLLLSAVAPGFALVHRLRWRPLETLCASIAASLTLLYLFTFALYVSGLPMAWAAVGSAVSLLLAIVHRRALAALVGAREVRRVAVGFLALFAWITALAVLVRHFSGGGWGVEWLQHFQRCLYFLHRLPTETVLHGPCLITARPPMMNLLGAYFLAHVGDDFACFQIVFVFLNVLPFLACALMARRLDPRGARSVAALTALFAACPLFVVNATYTWTKLLSAFFVIVALWFYLSARRTREPARDVAWSLALAGALLVHYSAGAFAVLLAAHFLWTLAREEPVRRGPIRLAAMAPGLLLLATWLGWALATFGLERTATANSSFEDSSRLGAGANVVKVVRNVVDTVVPHPLRGVSLAEFDQTSALGYARDYTFLIYQTNALVGVGSVGGVMVSWLLVRRLRARPVTAEARFWIFFVPASLVLGVATHGGRDLFGVAHVTLQPLVLLGVTLLATAARRLSRPAQWALVLGCAVDFGLGIALQHHVESFENTPEREVFAADAAVGADGALEWREAGTLSRTAWRNWQSKQVQPLLERQMERARRLPPERAARLVDAVQPEIERQERNDRVAWAGWFGRHDRRVAFLGDRFGRGAAAVRVIVAMGFVALLWPLVPRVRPG